MSAHAWRRALVTGGAGFVGSHLCARLVADGTDVGLPFDRLSALVADARAVVSGDTGIAHLAVAHATRSVTLFGPVPPSRWGPPAHPRQEGDPHDGTPDPALLRLHPEDVLAALHELCGTPSP